jgi:hypothetical protein
MKVMLLAATTTCLLAQTPDIGLIMSRVGINQAISEDLRKSFIYKQKQLLRMARGNGKLAREERREYVVTPNSRGVNKELVNFDGKFAAKGAFIAYDHPGYTYKSLDVDGELINELSEELTNNKQARDGIASDLFPLTYHQQLRYDFQFVKTETYRGSRVYRVSFKPKPHQSKGPDALDDPLWKGEALIDAAEYQPVYVNTSMATKIPLLVRTLLGTDLKGLGFSLSYQKFADGIWFPVSYGGEFEVRGLFLYKRIITVSMENSDFRRSEVTSSITYATDHR